jgi:hypothetical protein
MDCGTMIVSIAIEGAHHGSEKESVEEESGRQSDSQGAREEREAGGSSKASVALWRCEARDCESAFAKASSVAR